jgi:hypothetical protein
VTATLLLLLLLLNAMKSCGVGCACAWACTQARHSVLLRFHHFEFTNPV